MFPRGPKVGLTAKIKEILTLQFVSFFQLTFMFIFIWLMYERNKFPASIIYKSIAGRHRPVRVADGPITARYRFMNNASRFGINPFSPIDRSNILQTEAILMRLFMMSRLNKIYTVIHSVLIFDRSPYLAEQWFQRDSKSPLRKLRNEHVNIINMLNPFMPSVP